MYGGIGTTADSLPATMLARVYPCCAHLLYMVSTVPECRASLCTQTTCACTCLHVHALLACSGLFKELGRLALTAGTQRGRPLTWRINNTCVAYTASMIDWYRYVFVQALSLDPTLALVEGRQHWREPRNMKNSGCICANAWTEISARARY